MKHYNKLDSACEAARRFVSLNGNGAAVITPPELPGVYQVGTTHEARQTGQEQNIESCRLFYGITDRRHQARQPGAAYPVLETETALLHRRGQSNTGSE